MKTILNYVITITAIMSLILLDNSTSYSQVPVNPPNVVLNNEGNISAVSIHSGWINDSYKINPGSLVIKNNFDNNPPRDKVTITKMATIPDGATGNIIITRSSTNINVYLTQIGGTALTFYGNDNKFQNNNLPTLYVEGETASTNMGDISLTASAEGAKDSDTINYTVLWIDLITLNASTKAKVATVSTNNSCLKNWEAVNVINGSNLGLQLRYFTELPADVIKLDTREATLGVGYGIGYETIGHVLPSNFNPKKWDYMMGHEHLFSIHMDRDIQTTSFVQDNNGDFQPTPISTFTPPPIYSGNDPSSPVFRDDNPVKYDAAGKFIIDDGNIYDLDAPGFDETGDNVLKAFKDVPNDTEIRTRGDFHIFADAQTPTGPVICSSINNCYFAFDVNFIDITQDDPADPKTKRADFVVQYNNIKPNVDNCIASNQLPLPLPAEITSILLQAALPGFTPPPGIYNEAKTVNITCVSPGMTIRYTTDGSIPSHTNGTIYTIPIEIAQSCTQKAIAYDPSTKNPSMTDSLISGGFYIIQ